MRTIAEQTYLTLHQTSDTSILLGKTVDQILDETWEYLIPFVMTDTLGLTKEKVIKSICRHYWMREIGLETVGFWKLMIGNRLQEIMPKYEEMARAQAEMGSVWESQNMSKRHEGEFSTSGNENGEATSNKDGSVSSTGSKDGNVTGKDSTVNTESLENDSSRNESHDKNDDRTLTTNYGKITTDKNVEWSDLHKEDVGTAEVNEVGNTNQNNTVWHDLLNETNGKDTKKQNDKFSDTPQNGLTAVDDGMYLTTARIIDNNDTQHSTVNEHYNDSTNNNSNHDVTSTSNGNVKVTQNEGKNVDGSVSNSGNDTTTDRLTGTTTLSSTGKDTESKSGNTDFDTSRTTGETTKGNQTNTEHMSNTDSRNRSENGTDSYTDKWTGFQGDKVKTMADYNELYVNIYQLIIGEVAGFFMTIF